MDKFGLYTLHARKISNVGVYNMVHVFPHIRSFTCWEPQFDIADMNYFSHLSQVRKIYFLEIIGWVLRCKIEIETSILSRQQLTLLRIPFTEVIVNQILRYIEMNDLAVSSSKAFSSSNDHGSLQARERKHLEKICLEFVMQVRIKHEFFIFHQIA